MMKKRKGRNDKLNTKVISCILLLFMIMNPYASELICFGNQEEASQDLSAMEEVEEVIEDSPISDNAPAAALAFNERVVSSYAQLKDALSNDNGITAVYFGSDITMELTGIRIHPNKKNIIIDGFNPLNPDQAQPYTLTDYSSAAFTDTIYIDATGPEHLHVRNLKIMGKNYYGTFSILDAAILSNLVVTYERVDYNGPQIGYHRNGLIRFIDCSVYIHGKNGGSLNQEFAEAKHLLFEGVNTIETVTSTNTVFWHPYGGTFRVADDSILSLTSSNTSALYGIFYANGFAYKVDISIGEGAGFYAAINGVIAPAAYSTLNSLTVQEGGTFSLTAAGSPNEPILSMGGNLTISSNATFILNGEGSTSYAIINQKMGDIIIERDATFHIIASGSYPKLINLRGRAFVCNQPVSVLLYSAGRGIEAARAPGTVYVNAQQINYWNIVSEGGFHEPPNYSFKKNDKTSFWIKGELNIGSRGDFVSLSSNYTKDDSPTVQPSKETFSMVNARVLAFGHLKVSVNAPAVKASSITGVTAPGAAVRVSFSQQGINYILPDITADEEGVFRVNTGIPLEALTVITVKSSKQYLTAEAEITVNGRGDLGFSVPEKMDFVNTRLSVLEKFAKRRNPDWRIIVSDTRGAGSTWDIYVRLVQPLVPSDNTKPVLNDALVFVNNSITPLTSQGLLIYRHISVSDNDICTIHWAADKGILIQIPINIAYAEIAYTAVIEWTLVDGP